MGLFRKHSSDDERWVIAGLGNPGERYAGTRHNAGALVLDELARRVDASFKRHKSGCLIAEVTIGGARVVLGRPMSFMNESGRPVRDLARFFKVPQERVVVLHDEIDIPFGEVRVKWGGGTAGHNGLRSIVNHLGTKDFARLRVGVGRPPGYKGAVDHVLDRFSPAERKQWPEIVERAADAAERIVEVGVERAMNEVNTRAR